MSKEMNAQSGKNPGGVILEQNTELLRLVFEASPSGLVAVNSEGTMTLANGKMENLFGYRVDELLEQPVEMLVPERHRGNHHNNRDTFFGNPKVRPMGKGLDLTGQRKNGTEFPVSISLHPLVLPEGKMVLANIVDVSERKQAEERIRQQSREILELSTPVMQVWKGVVAAPLIGSLDSNRTQQFMERLLERIVETNSPVALVDITGVPTIDTQTAQHLIETIGAVRLLGAQVILTGVRPAIAQTLVHLGIDLSDVTTRASLSAGLQVALDALNLRVIPKGDIH